MAKNTWNFSRSVWVWPGETQKWFFVYVDGDVKDSMVKSAKTYGYGFIRVVATVGATSWETALFPHKKENCFLLPIVKAVRKKEGIDAGDTISITLSLV